MIELNGDYTWILQPAISAALVFGILVQWLRMRRFKPIDVSGWERD